MNISIARCFRRMTIRRRFSSLVLGVVIIVMIALGLLRAHISISDIRHEQTIKIHNTLELGTLSIADPLWNLHAQGIAAVGDALFNDQEIGRIIVRDSSRGVVYEKQRSEDPYQPEQLLTVEREIMRDGRTIGLLTLGVTSYYRDAAIAKDLWVFTFNSLLLLCILALLIHVVARFVTQPIYELSAGAEEIARGNLGKRLQLDYEDELGQLGQKFNLMAENLQDMLSELAAQNTSLQREMQERQAAQQALIASEEKFAKTFRYASDVVGIVNLQTRCFEEVNDAFFEKFGYQRAEVIGQSSDQFQLWADDSQRATVYQLLQTYHSFRDFESAWRSRDGTTLLGLCSAEVIEIAKNPHIIFAWHDITERKQAELALQQANDQLEAKVELRTQELTAANQELQAINEEQTHTLELLKRMQRQLIESEKMAALGSLVAGVAHEINTPVGVGVTAASHLLDTIQELRRRTADSSLTRRAMDDYLTNAEESSQMILSNLDRAANLVHSFKQVSVDQSREVKRPFNLKSYLNDIIRSLHSALKKTKLSVAVDCPDDLTLDSYPGSFAQIATNLIMNSLTHAYDPGEAGQLRFAVERQNDMIQLVYSDDGRGIAADVLPKIFDPFFTTRRGDGSTGLGLHILYNIVTQRLHGQVECRSEAGHGMQIRIVIPAVLPEQGNSQ